MAVARCCCPRPSEQPTTVVIEFDEINSYDAEQSVDVGTGPGLDNTDIASPFLFYECHQQWRYTNVTVPNGANISSAKLVEVSPITFEVASDGTTTPPNNGTAFVRLRWYGEDVDDAAPYTTPADYLTRPRTASFVDTADVWSTPPNNPSEYDVTAMVQEIVSRPGWASGNDMAIIAEENGSDSLGEGTLTRWAVYLEGGGADLEITYT